MSVPQCAMVLAAGLGKRMRPLTATRPKPLIEVAGAALVDHALMRLGAAGVRRAVVNVHYMADRLEAHLHTHPRGLEIAISDERDLLLETGGGVLKALPLIGCDPFLVVNSDNLWIDGPSSAVGQLAQAWDAERMDACLVMVPFARAEGYEGSGDFHMDPAGRLRRRTSGRVAPFVFSGIQMLGRQLFDGEAVRPFSLNRIYDRALERGRLYGVSMTGRWFHVGTPRAVAETEAALAHA